MYMKRAKENVEVMSKLDGKNYLITKVNADLATAYEIIGRNRFTKQPELGEVAVTITEDNAICYRIVRDPYPKEIPSSDGYYVSDGQLMKDGNKVTHQGEIYVEKILGEVELGFAILVRGKKEGEHQLMLYKLNDEFKNLTSFESDGLPQTTVLKDGYAFSYHKTERVSATENELEKVRLNEAAIILLTKEGVHETVVLPGIPTIGAGVNNTLFVNCAEIDDNGDPKDSETVCMVDIDNGCVSLPLHKVVAAREFFVNIYGSIGGYVVKSNNLILVVSHSGNLLYRISDKEAIEELYEHDFLVDAKEERGKVTFVFSDLNYQLKRCTIKKTADRGDIVIVENYTD